MADDFHSKSEAFMAWLNSYSATTSNKIALRDLRRKDAGRGVVATSDIEEDELLFSIPRTSVLSVENSQLSKKAPSLFIELDPWLSLIVVMIYEYLQGPNSIWKPYFDILPTEFDTLMFWTEEELAELHASAVREKIGKKDADKTFEEILVPLIRQNADTFFPGANVHPTDLDLVTLAHRMGSTIMAYAFDIEPVESGKEADEDGYVSEDEEEALPKGMVPLADMLNADADWNNARLFYEDEVLTMKALKPIMTGEEIFNDYGPLPRSDLLRRYGYVTDNYTPYDVVEISLELVCDIIKNEGKIDESSIENRIEYLDERGVVTSGYDISVPSIHTSVASVLSPELIILVESLLLPEAEWARCKKNIISTETLSPNGAETLLKIVKARAAQYSTTLAEDFSEISNLRNQIGESHRLSGSEKRRIMAKEVRHGEKHILDEAMKALTVFSPFTKRPEKRNDGAALYTGPNKKTRV
ncbi:SET domain-containing protein [Mytilinidion resinicola]|uniref:Ribosomal lysine N-methyltransferase 4 n=1 Tax=Mytilinidion resinicola TaxID=574789 RepID=A0A6A6YRC8_9PEZI|nr:SET domain-containing protein [Mytilinidion resinicola]KAF2811482.1 SET domain-containing protein [Mytilinidion resinicola]